MSRFLELEPAEVERHEGEIDILLGMDVVGLHPVEGVTRGNQRMMISQFGKGKMLVGAVPGVNCAHLDVNAVRLSQGCWELPPGAVVTHASAKVTSFDEFEDMQPEPLLSCRACKERCKGCRSCNFRAANLTEQEIESVEEMETAMVYDEEKKVIRVSYPLRPEADQSGNNYHQVKKIQENIERRVIKSGLHEEYNKEMGCMMEAGVVRALERQEILDYDGGVNYMPHFNVMNPESASTKLRIVVDSKCPNAVTGKSFNDLIKPVPNALNEISEVQLRWRMFSEALNYDLSKAYHSLLTGPREMHLRRFLFRFSPNEKWQIYVYRVVAFGDKPAALALELAKELAASRAQGIDAMAAHQMTRNSLVDDVGGGGSQEDVARMRGVKSEDGYSGTVPRVLECGGFRAKALVCSGTQDTEELEAMSGKFLGLGYDPTGDLIVQKVVPFIRMAVKRSRQRRAQIEVMTEDWLEDLRRGDKQLTKRRVLAFVMSQYDPLGLLAPLLLMAKLLLRPLYGSGYQGGWEDPLPEAQALRWQAFLTIALKTGELKVPRAVVWDSAEELTLVAFWDGSLDAHASCLYLRAQGKDAWGQDSVTVNLVYAKCRVAPLGRSTISKMELQGMVNVSRAVLKFVEAVDSHVARVVIAGDSMCALMSVRRDGTAYTPYFQHRVAEINRNLRDISRLVGELEPTLKVAGEINPADICTRGKATMNDVQEGSAWQNGPEVLEATS